MFKLNQRGYLSPTVLIIFAAVGILVFIILSQSADFKDNLFNSLYPKPQAEAARYSKTDIETFRGTVSVSSPATVTFNTLSNDTGVILTLSTRGGGVKTMQLYDSANNLVTTITVPADVNSWGTYVRPLQPSTPYRVVITNTEGSTRFLLYVNHCPDDQCF